MGMRFPNPWGTGSSMTNWITISPLGAATISTLRVDDICGVAADDILPLVGLDVATKPKNGLTIKIESVEWTPLRSCPGALSVSIFLIILL